MIADHGNSNHFFLLLLLHLLYLFHLFLHFLFLLLFFYSHFLIYTFSSSTSSTSTSAVAFSSSFFLDLFLTLCNIYYLIIVMFLPTTCFLQFLFCIHSPSPYLYYFLHFSTSLISFIPSPYFFSSYLLIQPVTCSLSLLLPYFLLPIYSYFYSCSSTYPHSYSFTLFFLHLLLFLYLPSLLLILLLSLLSLLTLFLTGNGYLDAEGFAPIGRVVSGMKYIDAIYTVSTVRYSTYSAFLGQLFSVYNCELFLLEIINFQKLLLHVAFLYFDWLSYLSISLSSDTVLDICFISSGVWWRGQWWGNGWQRTKSRENSTTGQLLLVRKVPKIKQYYRLPILNYIC